MRVKRHVYEVDGWGAGEVWVNDGVVVHHELASRELLGRAVEPAAAPGPRSPQSDGPPSHEAALLGPDPGPAPRTGGASPPTGTLSVKERRDSAGFVPELCRRFALHLEGQQVGYADVAIDLAWATPFQQALSAALRVVPWGDVVSYGELAALAGRPRAARAAGSFCADNRFALIVPCHRVVASDGIGGYGTGGKPLKRRLLSLEGIAL